MQTHQARRMPCQLSVFLLALLLTPRVGAAGDPEIKATTIQNEVGVEEQAVSADSKDLLKPHTFGWIEHVILSPGLRWKLDAKLDTGADTSSLDAHKIRRVKYKGQSYVRFSIRNPESGKMVSLRRPYVRTVRIRRHNGNHQRRRVVLMTVCLGHSERTIEVTLTDREFFDYPMLLGRSALSGLAVVNPMATYTTEPDCKTDFEEDEKNDKELAVEGGNPGMDRTVVQAKEKKKPANKKPVNKKEAEELNEKPTGEEKSGRNAVGAASGERSAHITTLEAYCASSWRRTLDLSGVDQPSGKVNVCT